MWYDYFINKKTVSIIMEKLYIKGLVTKIADGKYRVLASTSAIDRQGDSIDQAGWDISNFKLNPVMPWAHDYSLLPIAKVTKIEITKRGLEAEFEFAPAEGNPMAQQVKTLYEGGFLSAVSVGFIPKERKGQVITKSELLEISFVPVPANQEALRLAMKSLDITDPCVKGAIENELNAEEAYEKKWQNWCKIQDIFSAFWSVYFEEETPVENFNALLTESIALLQTVADGGEVPAETAVSESETTTDGGDHEMRGIIKTAISPETTKKYLETVSIKEGRTLSKKTLDCVEQAIESMKGATSVLEELKNASSESQDGQGVNSQAEEKGAEEETFEVPVIEESVRKLTADELPLFRQGLVAKDKQNEHVLSIVNALMREKGLK